MILHAGSSSFKLSLDDIDVQVPYRFPLVIEYPGRSSAMYSYPERLGVAARGPGGESIGLAVTDQTPARTPPRGLVAAEHREVDKRPVAVVDPTII